MTLVQEYEELSGGEDNYNRFVGEKIFRYHVCEFPPLASNDQENANSVFILHNENHHSVNCDISLERCKTCSRESEKQAWLYDCPEYSTSMDAALNVLYQFPRWTITKDDTGDNHCTVFSADGKILGVGSSSEYYHPQDAIILAALDAIDRGFVVSKFTMPEFR